MRRKICLTAILFVLLFLQAGCADQGDFIRKDGNLILEEEGIRVVLDEQTGMLKEFSSGDDSIGLKGLMHSGSWDIRTFPPFPPGSFLYSGPR